ncbi:Glutathione S-transferase, N-terminal [Dillenia turbinata]|uniref:Glutathione S-transferase n=1 Tax=Dillenia turbinata TaxID=194707 RepID=A0AAN8YZG9_9MAGN
MGENIVKLFGTQGSPFSKRVELALRVKGIPYEYIEEDLSNKSEQLLHYNPVYKKIPVLIHNGKAVAESLVILEYIEETWKHAPFLLPEDPYKRAQSRFWANFLHLQLFESIRPVITTDGEAQEKALKDLAANIQILEEIGVKEFFPDGISEITSENIGLLDIVICSILGPHKIVEQAIGVKYIDPEKSPMVYSWVTALTQLPVVKELAPPPEKMVALLQLIRQNVLRSARA